AYESAEVRLSELALGLGPFVIGPAVERRIGPSAFQSLAIDGDWRPSDWSLQHGLFSGVCDSVSDLDESDSQLALQLSHSNPQAMEELKKIFWSGTSHWKKLLEQRAALSGKLALSKFTREAMRAVEKASGVK